MAGSVALISYINNINEGDIINLYIIHEDGRTQFWGYIFFRKSVNELML